MINEYAGNGGQRVKSLIGMLMGIMVIFCVPLPAQSEWETVPHPTDDRLVLEDFSRYPEGWEARGGLSKANEIYRVVRHGQDTYLHAQGESESVRIFKKISWDSKTFPVIEWEWRIKNWPPGGQAQASLYISLDKDSFGIPALVKYLWSSDQAIGTVKDGGFFRPTEIVIRSGNHKSDHWIVERVDALADFQRIMGRDPKGGAYGIGFLADPGVEVEIGPIVALKRE
jgi:hypothetical protein